MSTRHLPCVRVCVTVICNLTYIECQQCLLCRTLGQGQPGASLHREESFGSTASLCYCQWLGAVLLHEASLPWQSPGEHNCTCTFMQTESAEKAYKSNKCQTKFQFIFCYFGIYQISCTFMLASIFFEKSKHLAHVAGPSPCWVGRCNIP